MHYAAEGADLVVVYLDEDADARQTASLLEARGQRCELIRGDVRVSAFCDAMVERAVERFGAINILVNNAAEQQDWS